MSGVREAAALDVRGADEALAEARRWLDDHALFPARLRSKDDSLWGNDPAHRRVAASRLGWIDSPARLRSEAAALRAFARDVAAEGFTHAVLLGMGGSSLAPETLRLACGVAPGALELTVLDDTSPAAVRAIAAAHDPRRTVFVVSSKSGGTVEVVSFERRFFEWVRAARGAEANRAFVAITDPGTALEALARERGYRRVFVNAPDIGGRYSALSYFGLVPAALIGAPLEAILDGALEEARASLESAAATSPGVLLGALLGTLARAGRDKLTLVLGHEIAPLGAWIEQLVAESTGKSGTGILPVAGEPLGAPAVYGGDRVFVAASVDPLPIALDARLDALAVAGHPVIRWAVPALDQIGAEFVRWEVATATAGAVLGVDPFDEPNVTEAKEATRAVLARFLEDGTPPSREAAAEPEQALRALLNRVVPGDYVALLAYVHRTPEREAALEGLRRAIRDATHAATTLGYGPRFLHSTGQLHKGGPNTGVFLQLLADESPDEPIPGERYGFEALRDAQAAGDAEVLAKRGRRLARVWLGQDVEGGVRKLTAAVAG